MVDDNLVKAPQIIMDRFAHQFDLLAARAHANGKDSDGRQAISITQVEPVPSTAVDVTPTTQPE
jgi:hypothetical protein